MASPIDRPDGGMAELPSVDPYIMLWKIKYYTLYFLLHTRSEGKKVEET